MPTQPKTASTSQRSKNPYSFYTSAEYYVTLIKHINETKPGSRITLASLLIRPEEPISAAVLSAATDAAKRGVEVTLVVDAFTFLIKAGVHPGPSFFFGKPKGPMPPSFRRRLAALQALEAAGGRYAITNPIRKALTNPFVGRSHIKYSVINDEVFIGGCNLAHTDLLDVMVSWHDPNTADWLRKFTEDTITAGSVAKALKGQDVLLPTNNHASLLVDAGVPNKSIIFDKALQIIEAAKNNVLITFQYFPDGKMADCLSRAETRGADLKIIYNSPKIHIKPLNLVYGHRAKHSLRDRTDSFTKHQLPTAHHYLHAKIIIADQTTILSSHNYMPYGVEVGTAEIGLITSDPEFARGVEAALKRQLQQ